MRTTSGEGKNRSGYGGGECLDEFIVVGLLDQQTFRCPQPLLQPVAPAAPHTQRQNWLKFNESKEKKAKKAKIQQIVSANPLRTALRRKVVPGPTDFQF